MLISYIMGIIIQRNNIILTTKSLFLFCLIVLFLSFISYGSRWNLTGVFLLLCFLLFGMLNISFQSQPLGSNHIYQFVNKPGILTGRICEAKYDSNHQYLEILLSVQSFKEYDQHYAVQGKVLLIINGDGSSLQYGDLIEAKVVLQEPPLPNNFGEFNYREYLIRQKIFVTDRINTDQIALITSKRQIDLPYLINSLRNKIENKIDILYRYPYNALIKAVTTGNRKEIPLEWENIFQDAGTMHILAISGLHVGIIASALFFIFRLIPYLRKRKNLSYALIIVFLLGYAAIAGFRPSVNRAALMFITMLGARYFNRPYHLSNSLYWTAFLLLFYQPLLLFDAGFSLSFTVTFFIIFLYPIIKEKFNFLPLCISQPLTVSTAAWLGMAPLSAYFFYKVSFIALLSNLVIVPLISVILVLGIISIGFSVIYLPFAGLFVLLNQIFINFLIQITKLFTSLPFAAIYLAQPKIYQIIYYYLFIISFALILSYWFKLNMEKKKKIFWVMFVSLTIFLTTTAAFSPNLLSVHFINVGQGDSILIRTPQKKNILIDGGGVTYGDFDVGRQVVIPYLRRLGVRNIDLMVLTHPDLDHLKGLIPVLKEMKVKMVIDSGIGAEDRTYSEFHSLITENKDIFHYQVDAGDTISLEPDLKIIALNSANMSAYGYDSNFNNHSIVLKLLYGKTSFLFTADIEELAEINMLYWDNLLKSDVLKVAHHGSITSSTDRFLEKVQPEVAVISVGINNFNHPHPDVIGRLEVYCQRLFRTDFNGTVLISSNGQKYYIRTLR